MVKRIKRLGQTVVFSQKLKQNAAKWPVFQEFCLLVGK
jgi:hypothetical protein